MQKALLILNPKAGKQGAKQHFYDIITGLSQKYDILVHVTKNGEDIYECARDCELDTVIVCGGDGTLSHAVNGIIDNPNCQNIKIGYLPMGTANDVASSIGIPKKLDEAINYLCQSSPKKQDVGQIGKKNFIYIASFGTFTKASYETPQDVKNVFGGFAYLLTGASEITNIKEYRAVISYDDGVLFENEIAFLAVLNTFYIGGGLIRFIKENVQLADGKLELLIIRKPKNLFELESLVRNLTVGNFDDRNICLLQSSRYNIKLAQAAQWTIDGEKGRAVKNADICCREKAINIIKK